MLAAHKRHIIFLADPLRKGRVDLLARRHAHFPGSPFRRHPFGASSVFDLTYSKDQTSRRMWEVSLCSNVGGISSTVAFPSVAEPPQPVDGQCPPHWLEGGVTRIILGFHPSQLVDDILMVHGSTKRSNLSRAHNPSAEMRESPTSAIAIEAFN